MLQKIVDELDKLPEIVHDPLFAGIRICAMRNDRLRFKLLDEFCRLVIQDDISEFKQTILLDFME